MNVQDFTCSITVNVTAAEAFDAITKVSEWWAKHVEGSTKSEGGSFTTRFGETFGVFKITEAIAGQKITWQVVDCYLPIFKNVRDWDGTNITWEISAAGEASQITFTHIGLVPGKECYNDCCDGWSFYVKESLYKLITEGQGLPGTGIRATISNGDRVYKGTLFFKNDPLPDFPGDFVLIDVKELNGEHVVAANSARLLDRAAFSPEQIAGNYYMMVEDLPLFAGISPLDDILDKIKTI
ncbi:MAG TPA: SRPBCC domain-containing protein [Chitinophagaceae bacterium]|nr:SRPBCC domain-containing protein [Chitinophagaceae bacterium]